MKCLWDAIQLPRVLFCCLKGLRPKADTPGERGGGGGWGWVTGMRVFSLWGVNYRFWSHVGCLGWKVTKFARFRYCLRLCVKKISFRGQFKLEPHPPWSPLGISFEFSDEHPRHFLMGVSPTPPPLSDTQPQTEKEKDRLPAIKRNVLKS